MKKYKLILFLSTAFLSVACTDSFFDLEPSSSVPTDKVYKTADDFNVAVMGCYSKLQTQVSYFTECCEYRSDNLTLSAPTAGTQDRYDIDQFADKASNGILENAWANFNNGVYRCNLILDRIDEANFDATLKKQYKGEDRILIPSPKVQTYDLKPEMSAIEVTDKVVKAINSDKYNCIILNYANPDMVGHTGNLEATIKAIETIDGCVERVVKAMEEKDRSKGFSPRQDSR